VATQLAASAVTAFSADPMQRRIMFALPFVFVVFIINFEAGLIVYWITTNVWTIGQQLLVKKLYPKPQLTPSEDDGTGDGKPARGKPPAAKPSPAAAAAVSAKPSGGGNGGPTKAPPRSPRKKKKRSGRRR
jgi:YidC/Oxa1 family membrane protein insertase